MYAVYFEGSEIKAAVCVGLLTVTTYVRATAAGFVLMTADQIEKYLLTLRNTN